MKPGSTTICNQEDSNSDHTTSSIFLTASLSSYSFKFPIIELLLNALRINYSNEVQLRKELNLSDDSTSINKSLESFSIKVALRCQKKVFACSNYNLFSFSEIKKEEVKGCMCLDCDYVLEGD